MYIFFTIAYLLHQEAVLLTLSWVDRVAFVPFGNSERKCSFYGLSAVVNVVSLTVILKISAWRKLQGVIIETD